MRNFLAVLLAGFLAVATAAETGAADRSVGPETGSLGGPDTGFDKFGTDDGGPAWPVIYPDENSLPILTPPSDMAHGGGGTRSGLCSRPYGWRFCRR